jgi:hypothetical protein
MKTILAHAQGLVYTLLGVMPSTYQRDSLQALLGLFLQAQGHPLPEYCQVKSASALSRFLNEYPWSTREMIRQVRQAVLAKLLSYRPRGRRPCLQVIIDLTSLEKRGKFKAFDVLISVLDGKRGLHLVVLYLVVGQWRVPWSFRVYRGKGTPSPAQLGLRLVRRLPCVLKRRFQVMVLADTAFGSVEFLQGIRQLKYHAVVGVRRDRKLVDGRHVSSLYKRGQQVRLHGLPFVVSISWFYLKRDGKWEKRFVLSTRAMKASTINWWGKRRWQIEGWFKTAKHRFGLHRFAQQTKLGMYRWLILSLIAYLLAHWAYLSSEPTTLPDWGQVAHLALHTFLPQVVVCVLLTDILRSQPLLQAQGIDIKISWCKM